MTDIIQELRSLIEKATPGPWVDQAGSTSGRAIVSPEAPKVRRNVAAIGGDRRDANAALIVAAINHLPALLDRLEAAERRVDFLDMRRPIKGIERRSNEEVFAIMADRIRLAEAGHYRFPPAIREVKP